ncbi:hypothetical protein Tco_0737179 [Tanacetum coccineum]
MYLKVSLKKLKQEKEGIGFKIEKFDKASKDLDKLLGSQITDKSKKGLGYSVVPPPHPLIYNRPKKLYLSYSGLDEFKEPKFKGYGYENSKQESNIVEFVKPKNHEKPVKKSVRHMTGNIAYLSYFKEFDEGYVTFGEEHMVVEFLVPQEEFNAGTSEEYQSRLPCDAQLDQDCLHTLIQPTQDVDMGSGLCYSTPGFKRSDHPDKVYNVVKALDGLNKHQEHDYDWVFNVFSQHSGQIYVLQYVHVPVFQVTQRHHILQSKEFLDILKESKIRSSTTGGYSVFGKQLNLAVQEANCDLLTKGFDARRVKHIDYRCDVSPRRMVRKRACEKESFMIEVFFGKKLKLVLQFKLMLSEGCPTTRIHRQQLDQMVLLSTLAFSPWKHDLA